MALLALPSSVSAQEEPPEGAMLIILDASGSMNNVDEDGIPFIDKAKDAVLELIDALPEGMQVGLRVYGHREPNTDPVRGCQDTELVAPVTPLDRGTIRDAVQGIDASGFTPIGLALREAAADLPESGPRSIVLISDGEDTCAPPDPCQVAEELYGDLFDVRIESVGFLIDTGSAAEQQLRCIAESTGGTYTTVGSANALAARLGEVTDELLTWRPPMTLNGALDWLTAAEFPLAPKADWVTDEPGKIAVGQFGGILMPGETRWYQLDLWERESAWIWSDLEWPPGLDAGGAFETIILDSDGNRVETPVGHGEHPLRTELPGSDSPMTGAAIQTEEGWPAQARYLVGLHWDAPAEVFLGSLHVAVEVLNDPMSYGARTELEGALDPAQAPELTDGLTEEEDGWRGGQFRGPLASGETRWYRMDLERGEVMNAFAIFPGDRYVGRDAEGEFSIELADLEGTPVGRAFDEWPQMSQSFGTDRHQATVSGTTSFDPDPVPESVLIGFTWSGSPGRESEIIFEAEAVFDQGRKQAADRIEAEANQQNDESPSATSFPANSDEGTTSLSSDEDPGGDGFPAPVAVGVLAGGAALAVLLFKRFRRRRPSP
jgi:Ca-activated chloride channel family protein